MNADHFAGRYELLHEAPPGAAGRLFEARDTQTGELVALKVFRHELPAGAAERADLERAFAAAHACQHPRIARYHALSTQDGYLVREWIHGFPLIDLLRRRRELPGLEVVTLLHDTPETIDAAVAADLAPTGDLLSRLFVCWDRSLPLDELARLRGVPVTEWKDFTVKLSPINLSHVLPLSPEETMSTMVAPMLAQAGPLLSPAVSFAEMIYQLLGAPRRSDRHRRYVPLGTLNEAGNLMLRRVIEGGTPPASCTAFWKELVEASGLVPPQRRASVAPPPLPFAAPPPSARPPAAVAPPPLPKRRTLRIPDAFLRNVQPGTLLRLTPRDISFTPIHLIARTSFRIGRSLYHSDFITRVLPETPDNEKLTKEIGRVHVLAELRDGQITLRDGNGEQPSVNGSAFDGQPLSHEVPTPLAGRGILNLYRNYELEIAPLLGSADLGCHIENELEWNGPSANALPVSGAVVFHPQRNQPTLRESAWLFSRLDFAVSPRGDVVWCEAGSPLSQGSFLFSRGCFWLAIFTPPPGTIFVNQAELPPNSAVPLAAGLSVRLGPGAYVIEIQ